MGGKIYLVNRDGGLLAMEEAPYEAESLLQTLLAEYPDLLAGDQMRPSSPRRWLLVSRELGVPEDGSEKGRWSLDHLFIDQEGIPTLVEVKRSSNTQIRREVVGQMLDYAANGTVYWSLEQITAAFDRRCERDGLDPDEVVGAFLGEDTEWSAGEFWQAVKTNLQAGRVRLVFVADRIPAELRRIIEFLNDHFTWTSRSSAHSRIRPRRHLRRPWTPTSPFVATPGQPSRRRSDTSTATGHR